MSLLKFAKNIYTHIGRKMLEFEILFNNCKKIQKNENENKSFLLKLNKIYVKSIQ